MQNKGWVLVLAPALWLQVGLEPGQDVVRKALWYLKVPTLCFPDGTYPYCLARGAGSVGSIQHAGEWNSRGRRQ